MKSAFGLLSILLTAAIGMGIYLFYAKQSAPAPHMVVTQNISVTGVKSDIMTIAQAERMYFVQNGSYTDLPSLASSGTMNITRTSRDGYTYSVDPSASGFTVTATYTAPPPEMPAGVAPPHFPTFTIDQTMEIHQGE
jgi:hypothetical protein